MPAGFTMPEAGALGWIWTSATVRRLSGQGAKLPPTRPACVCHLPASGLIRNVDDAPACAPQRRERPRAGAPWRRSARAAARRGRAPEGAVG